MAKRKSTGKRQRFNIFKRDKFTCQYCGRTPPAIVLVLDHILPVAKGGETVDHNLITSCEVCNQGKADGLLGDVPQAIDNQLAAQVERREQLEEFNRYLMTRRKKDTKAANEIGVYWCSLFHPGENLTFGNDWHMSAVAFLRRMPQANIYDAVDKARSKFPSNERRAFRYFCGICWKTIKEAEGG